MIKLVKSKYPWEMWSTAGGLRTIKCRNCGFINGQGTSDVVDMIWKFAGACCEKCSAGKKELPN